jgi:MarR family 2-MHQ and catechol resistance regulon transcriptional repressor
MAARPVGVDDARVIEALGAYVKLLRTARAVLARVEPRLVSAGLTPTQFGVLEAILHKGPLSQRDLSRKVLTSAGNMTDLVDKLEARGLVRRTRQKLDRRAVLVELTAAGGELIGPLFTQHAGDIAAAMAALNGEELRQLGALLRKLGLASTDAADGETEETAALATDGGR